MKDYKALLFLRTAFVFFYLDVLYAMEKSIQPYFNIEECYGIFCKECEQLIGVSRKESEKFDVYCNKHILEQHKDSLDKSGSFSLQSIDWISQVMFCPQCKICQEANLPKLVYNADINIYFNRFAALHAHDKKKDEFL